MHTGSHHDARRSLMTRKELSVLVLLVLLCAVVADGMVDDRHDSNQELMAQGIANIASPLFGGIAATGAIARTATNVKCGARTPIAGMVHAVTLLLIILAAAPLAKFIPLATLSAVLVNVALNMGEWHNFGRLAKWPRSDAVVFLTAFGLTVIIDLTVAVEIGMVAVGDPDDCAKAVQRWVDIGADQLCFSPTTNNLPTEVVVESMELFGKEVLPQFDKDPVHSTTRQREAFEKSL